MEKNNKIYLLNFLIKLIILSSVFSQIKNSKININTEKQISSILKWAKDNQIYINEKLILNKNTDSSHNFFYFTSNDTISNNTLLLKVPYNIMISQNILNQHFHEIKSKTWSPLWDEIVKNNNPYISDFLIKQIFYISIIIENAIRRKKGSIYKKYESYFDMYEYINMDNFPLFYEEDEISFLSTSSIGEEIAKSSESIKEEYKIITNELKISKSIYDNYLTYRVLTLANSVSFNNINLDNDYNETVVVPFIDCFKKVISNRAVMAKYYIKKDKKNNYYLEIRSIKKIKKDKEIKLQWLELSNQDSLLFYGFTEKGNEYVPGLYVDLFNNAFKKELGVDPKENFKGVIKRDVYEISSEILDEDIIQTYKKLAKKFYKYKNKKEGKYEMMMDNLKYYLKIYEDKFTEDKIKLYIRDENKRKIIKELLKTEKKIIQNKVDYIKEIIEDIKKKKNNKNNDL